MEKIVTITAAYDKRHDDPSKNYGVHGCELRMVLRGELGATQFVLFTNWQLPHVAEEFKARDVSRSLLEPMPAGFGYHSPKPMYEGQDVVGDSCEYLDGKPCYYDGGGLYAETVFERMLKEGDEGVWAELEQSYVERFGELK
jgi:hypothetical protein